MSDLPAKHATIDAFRAKFAEIRRESEQAIAQLDAEQLRRSLDGDVNSVAIVMKHVGGNLASRFTDFLTSDGEKLWRSRDAEFIDDFPPGEAGRDAAFAAWRAGWSALETALRDLTDADLDRVIAIRGVPHSVAQALARSLAHISYHQGQIVLTARVLVGPARWKSISIPRGGTAAYLKQLDFDPTQPPADARERPVLFLLEPDFLDPEMGDPAMGEGPWYCPHCAQVEGLLAMYPQLRARLDIRRVGFAKPRSAIVEFLGPEVQSCPMLVLPLGTPTPPVEHRVVRDRTILVGGTAIGGYFAHWAHIGRPH
jgi:uncharacterized damage-inducible protein DinB